MASEAASRLEVGAPVEPFVVPRPLSLQVLRLRDRIPEAKLEEILRRWADRLDELAETKGSADLSIGSRVHRGAFLEASFDPDIRIA